MILTIKYFAVFPFLYFEAFLLNKKIIFPLPSLKIIFPTFALGNTYHYSNFLFLIIINIVFIFSITSKVSIIDELSSLELFFLIIFLLFHYNFSFLNLWTLNKNYLILYLFQNNSHSLLNKYIPIEILEYFLLFFYLAFIKFHFYFIFFFIECKFIFK